MYHFLLHFVGKQIKSCQFQRFRLLFFITPRKESEDSRLPFTIAIPFVQPSCKKAAGSLWRTHYKGSKLSRDCPKGSKYRKDPKARGRRGSDSLQLTSLKSKKGLVQFHPGGKRAKRSGGNVAVGGLGKKKRPQLL